MSEGDIISEMLESAAAALAYSADAMETLAELMAALRLTVNALSPPRNAEEAAAIAAAKAALRKADAIL